MANGKKTAWLCDVFIFLIYFYAYYLVNKVLFCMCKQCCLSFSMKKLNDFVHFTL